MEKMDKRALSKVPRPTVTKNLKSAAKKLTGKEKGLMTSERIVVDGKDTLVVNAFLRRKGELKPEFRTFLQKDGDITQDLIADKVRWMTAMWHKLSGQWYIPEWGRGSVQYIAATDLDEQRVKDYVSETMEWNGKKLELYFDRDYEDYLFSFQDDIRYRRLMEKHRKKLEHEEAQMALFGDLPDDYPEFVQNQVFGDYHFLFYSRKKNHAYCTHCKREFRLNNKAYVDACVPQFEIMPLHNQETTCPYCGKIVTAKSEGYSRNCMKFVRWSELVQTNGEKVLVRYIRHIKDFSDDYTDPKTSTDELFRTVHGNREYEDYELGMHNITKKIGWHKPYKRSPFWNPSEYSCPSQVVLYNTSWDNLAGTCLQYSCTELYLKYLTRTEEKTSPWELDNWWVFYQQYPFIEQFLKLGWVILTRDLLHQYGRADAKAFENGKNICKTLRMTKEQFRFLRAATDNNPRMIDVRIIWYAEKLNIKMSEKDHRTLRLICKSTDSGLYKELLDLCEYTTAYKLTKWIRKQKNFHVNDWLRDYLKWARELGKDLHDEYVLLPPNFLARHDALQQEYLEMKDKEKAKEFKAHNEALKKMRLQADADDPSSMHAGGLLIRAPYKIEELKTEREILHHCVGTYADRVMSGETMIFFIRTEKNPEKPFYTLEWRNHHIVQCRGKKNCDMTPHVKAFTKIFEERMKEYESKHPNKETGVKVV